MHARSIFLELLVEVFLKLILIYQLTTNCYDWLNHDRILTCCLALCLLSCFGGDLAAHKQRFLVQTDREISAIVKVLATS